MSGVRIVSFCEAHIEKASEIEKMCFSEPWSKESMRLLCSRDYPSLAAIDENGVLCGYVSSARALDELQIINVAVHPDMRRKGIASALLASFDTLCEKEGIASVSLEVRVSNYAAIALYERFGYQKLGFRKRFYRAPVEDAHIMVKKFK